MKRFFCVICKILVIYISCGQAFAVSELEVLQNARNVAQKAFSIYREGGMSGLMIESQNCWKENNVNKLCLYHDFASFRIEQLVIVGTSIPPHEYFSSNKIQDRSGEFFVKNFRNKDDANAYMAGIEHIINASVADSIAEAYAKKQKNKKK
ncbi:MAG: hypothetical protein K2Y28_01370 [Burkholderiaceae bacterium]|nr:hypothetical protein [Burkholderiaceae bacterium]